MIPFPVWYFLPAYLFLCLIFPEFNIIALLLIGKVLYEPRLSLFYPFSLNHLSLLIMGVHIVKNLKKIPMGDIKISQFKNLILFTGWLILNSLLLSYSHPYALEKILSLLFMAVLPILLISLRFRIYKEKVMYCLLISITLMTIILFCAAIYTFVLTRGFHRLAVFGGGPISLSRSMGMGIIILIFLSRNYQGLWTVSFLCTARVFIIAMTIILLLTFTKGPVLSLFCVFGLDAVIRTRKSRALNRRFQLFHRWKPFLKNGMIILIYSLLLICLLTGMDTVRQVTGNGVDVLQGSYIIRLTLMKQAIAAFLQSPILGIGLGNFAQNGADSLYPHNMLLEVLAESGLIGFSLLFILIRPLISVEYEDKTTPQIFYLLAVYMFLNQMVSCDLTGARFFLVFLFSFVITNDYKKTQQFSICDNPEPIMEGALK